MSTPEPGPPAWPGTAPSASPHAPLPPYAGPGAPVAPPVAPPVAWPPAPPVGPPAAWGAPPPAPGTDGLAVAAFVLALASFATSLLTAPVGLGLGIAAQRRVRRSGAEGRGLAIAATCIGGVLTAALVVGLGVVVALGVASTASTASSAGSWPAAGDAAGAPGEPTTLPWFELAHDLVPGDCLATAPETYDMSDAGVVDCASGHATEVLEQLSMAEPVRADVTEPDAAYTALLDRCAAVAERLVGSTALPAESWADVYFVHPDQWAAGDRWAYCVLSTEPAGTGSVLAGTFAAGSAAEV
ncbi:DUF4190 domain-containing protein [Cellulomonas sp. Y8]|uniref:DUF4190 domain-containing protein n=1 Tax=Cellulomonas sp. Y8 TaxID=2591145 RepID=UPI003D75F7DB